MSAAAWSIVQPADGWTLHIAASERGICGLSMTGPFASAAPRDDAHPLLAEAARQLYAYFRGELRVFDLPLDLAGTEFQQRVWSALRRIPYGETCSYAALAREIGSPGAFRAVGAANGANPVAIIVPCHRVIASDGTLCGFGGGLDRKRYLLELEASTSLINSSPLFTSTPIRK